MIAGYPDWRAKTNASTRLPSPSQAPQLDRDLTTRPWSICAMPNNTAFKPHHLTPCPCPHPTSLQDKQTRAALMATCHSLTAASTQRISPSTMTSSAPHSQVLITLTSDSPPWDLWGWKKCDPSSDPQFIISQSISISLYFFNLIFKPNDVFILLQYFRTSFQGTESIYTVVW